MKRLSRRTLLRGGGGLALSLPLLEAMLPQASAQAADTPRRILFEFKPNGDQTLEYGTAGSGFIKSIFLETKTSTPLCSFDGAANKLKHFSILDY